MHKSKLFMLLFIIFIFILLTQCNSKQDHSQEQEEQEDTPYLTRITKEWTYLLYNDADFDPGYDPMQDFSRDMYCGENLHVVVLRDIHQNNARDYNGFVGQNTDDSTAGIYLIKERSNPDLLETMGEINMGNPATLTDFILYAKDLYPARRYILAFYDHGGGYKGACTDHTNQDWLYMDEIRKGIEDGGGVDIVMFTAPCLMGAVESVYEVREIADVYIGSENTSGYIYWINALKSVRDALETTPGITTFQLGKKIIQSIEENLSWLDRQYNWNSSDITMSAVRVDKINDIVTSFGEICDYYLQNEATFNTFADLNYEEIETYYNWNMDLVSLLTRLSGYEEDDDVKSKINRLTALISESVLYEIHGTDFPDSHGLAIYFPDKDIHPFDSQYPNVQFAQHTQWDQLVGQYFELNNVPHKILNPIEIFRRDRLFPTVMNQQGGVEQ